MKNNTREGERGGGDGGRREGERGRERCIEDVKKYKGKVGRERDREMRIREEIYKYKGKLPSER